MRHYRLECHRARIATSSVLSIEEAAHRAKLHSRHWQKLEAGEVNVTIGTLARVSDALDLSVPELLT